MTTYHALLGFEGRLNRLAYFGYTVLAAAFAIVAFLIAAAFVSFKSDLGNIVAGLGGIVVFGLWVWSGFALLVKRLHDLDMAGTHAIWIYLLSFASGLVQQESPALAALLALAYVGVALWLLFAKGTTGPNRFGADPLAVAVPVTATP